MLPADKIEKSPKCFMAIDNTVKAPKLIAALAAELDRGRWKELDKLNRWKKSNEVHIFHGLSSFNNVLKYSINSIHG